MYGESERGGLLCGSRCWQPPGAAGRGRGCAVAGGWLAVAAPHLQPLLAFSPSRVAPPNTRPARHTPQVRVGGSCDLDPAELAEALAEVTDAVVVHQIGFTFTLYRDKSLPRRSRKEAMAALAAVLEEEEEGESEGEDEGGSDGEQEEEGSGGEEVGEQQRRQRQQGAAGGARSAGDGSSSGAAQGPAGAAAAAAAEGDEEGEWEGEEGSDSDDEEAAALAEEVDVVIGGVKRRIQKPPEFIVIKD